MQNKDFFSSTASLEVTVTDTWWYNACGSGHKPFAVFLYILSTLCELIGQCRGNKQQIKLFTHWDIPEQQLWNLWYNRKSKCHLLSITYVILRDVCKLFLLMHALIIQNRTSDALSTQHSSIFHLMKLVHLHNWVKNIDSNINHL